MSGKLYLKDKLVDEELGKKYFLIYSQPIKLFFFCDNFDSKFLLYHINVGWSCVVKLSIIFSFHLLISLRYWLITYNIIDKNNY